MAIAALYGMPSGGVGVRPAGPDEDLLDNPWPRPTLRLLEAPAEAEEVLPAPGTWEQVEAGLPVRTGVEVPVRRQARRRRQVRRRRVGAALVVAGLLVLLALPVAALGGRAATAAHPTGPAASAVAGGRGSVYVVQPGDTLWSIASRADRGTDPRPLVRELAAETGSEAVYPGERIVLP